MRSLLLLAFLFVSLPSMAASQHPNFIVFVLDDWAAGDAGVYGNRELQTPTIDRLAKEGVRFDNAFLTTASCTASRASILTGRYPSQSGAPNLHDHLPKESVLVSRLLREVGYFTAAAGKWHIGPNVQSQFDMVRSGYDPSGAEYWLKILEQRPKNKPFFLWYSAYDPHLPYDPEFVDPELKPEGFTVPPFLADGPKTRQVLAQYYSEVQRVDEKIGEVLKELENQGELDNTVVMVLSDNGAPFPRAKTTLYDSGVKTPLVVAGPGILQGRKESRLVSVIDLVPTILSISDIKQPDFMAGRPFAKLLVGSEGYRERRYIYAEQFAHGHKLEKRALRNHDFLYIHNATLTGPHCLFSAKGMHEELVELKKREDTPPWKLSCFSNSWPEEELYAVGSDPHNLHNLADNPDQQHVLEHFRKALKLQLNQLERLPGYPPR